LKPSSKRRSAASSKPAHPVDVYAARVCGDPTAGDPIIAGPLVRLACERHRRDRETGPARGLRFDTAKASHAIDFFPQFLRLPDGPRAGDPFHLSPHQQFLIGSFAGWCGPDGDLRFVTVYHEEGKGGGKSPLWAGYGLYRLVTARDAQQIFIAAVTADQSRIMFRDCERFVERSPHLRRKIHQTVNNLAHASSGAFLRTVSSETRSLDGKRISLALIDEVHEHLTPLVCDKMRAGLKGAVNAQIVELTNAGYDRTSVCWAHHELSRQVLEGAVENDSWFAFVAGLDDGDDPLTDPTCWVKSNPNVGVSIPEKYLREQVAEANQMATKANIVLRLNFCVWTQAETRAINMTQWGACQPLPSAAELEGAPCFAGLDLGQSDDFSALLKVWVLGDGRLAVVPRFWLPQGALDRYPNRPYAAWQRAGVLDVTDGDVTDLDQIEDAVAAECAEHGIKEVAYDKRFAQQLAQHLVGQGITMVDTPQGFQLNEALTKLFASIVTGELCHGNHPILTWMASNAVTRTGRLGEVRLDKESAGEKVDGIAALAMALDRVVRSPVEPETSPDELVLVV
jgi:phage terminase large subunit-like protein